MSKNRGHTSLRCRSRNASAMQEFDRLPPELRNWLSKAILPWSSRSVNLAYTKATSRTRNTSEALAELDRIQNRLIAKDAAKVWGSEHPEASGQTINPCQISE